jgi:hypothetical protein
MTGAAVWADEMALLNFRIASKRVDNFGEHLKSSGLDDAHAFTGQEPDAFFNVPAIDNLRALGCLGAVEFRGRIFF